MTDHPENTGHGSPELDADADKLRALGADPGPTFGHILVVSLQEAAETLIASGGVPALIDAAENVAIAYDMGWDLGGVMQKLKDVVFRD